MVSGVPQGSVLGPLLFLLYLNDLPENIRSSLLKMFADDTKLSHNFEKSLLYSELLQQDINGFSSYCNDWQLTNNADKCCVLSLGSGAVQNDVSHYRVNDCFIGSAKVIQDLGVFVSSPDLKFTYHISKTINKGSRACGLIVI